MDVVAQSESVGFSIEWSNGNIEEGELWILKKISK
jgi:hypothetical protein